MSCASGIVRRRLPGMCLAVCVAGAADAQVCHGPIVGVDPGLSDSVAYSYFCRGEAQVFDAVDTLVRAITVWGPPHDYVDYEPRYLFVMETRDGRPSNAGWVYGPRVLTNLIVDAVNPIKYRWEFDPPLALPYRGKFALDVQARDRGVFGTLAVMGNPYAGGQLCRTGPVFDCSIPGTGVCQGFETLDLCFKVEFCADAATAVRGRGWGKLKLLYR